VVLVIATSAFAGEMHTDVKTPAPPPVTSSEMQTGAEDGEMHTGDVESAPDTSTEAALTLLQSLLTLF